MPDLEEIREPPTSLWQSTKNLFVSCTRGYEAKVINVVGYALLQIIIDLTFFQLMLRYWLSEWMGTTATLDMSKEIVPTFENVTMLFSFFTVTFFGAFLGTYCKPVGTMLLALTQLAAIVQSIYFMSKPMMSSTMDEYLADHRNFCFETDFWLWLYSGMMCGIKCFLYFTPTFLSAWFFYCTSTLTACLYGYQLFENQPNFNLIRKGFTLIPIKPKVEIEIETASTISTSDQSTPAETDYFSDNSSN